MPNHELGGRAPDGTWHKAQPIGTGARGLQWPQAGDFAWCLGYRSSMLRIVRIVLTVAHLNHTPEDCRPENLRAWCQRCHNRYDAAERRKGIQQRARAARASGDLFARDQLPRG